MTILLFEIIDVVKRTEKIRKLEISDIRCSVGKIRIFEIIDGVKRAVKIRILEISDGVNVEISDGVDVVISDAQF